MKFLRLSFAFAGGALAALTLGGCASRTQDHGARTKLPDAPVAEAADEAGASATQPELIPGTGLRVAPRRVSERGRKANYEIRAEYPQIEGEIPEAAEKFNAAARRLVLKEVDAWREFDVEPKEADASSPFADQTETLDIRYYVTLARPDLLSVKFYVDMQPRGAAHGVHEFWVVNYDLRRGREWRLEQLFRPGSDYLRALSRYCAAELRGRPDVSEYLFPDALDENRAGQAADFENWNLTDEGLLIAFDEYRVAAYAAGRPEVLVPDSALAEFIDPRGPVPTPGR